MVINFGSGTIYILDKDGSYTNIGTIKEAEVTSSDYPENTEYICKIEDLGCTFEAIARLSKEAFLYISGVTQAVIQCCPNRKVVHLCLHAKKKRTRKKNFNRAIKILEEMVG